jgi:hypothetical protein
VANPVAASGGGVRKTWGPYLSSGRNSLISQSSGSSPLVVMNVIFEPSGDQPNSLRWKSSGSPVWSSAVSPVARVVIQILPPAL